MEKEPQLSNSLFNEERIRASVGTIRSFRDPQVREEIHAQTIDQKTPIVDQFVLGDRAVTLVGVVHTKQENATTQSIKEQSTQLDPAKDVVIVEGYHGKIPFDEWSGLSPEEVLERYGESGLTAKLAYDRGIPVANGEIPEQEASRELRERGHAPDDILLFQILRSLKSQMSGPNQLSYENFAKLGVQYAEQSQPEWYKPLTLSPSERDELMKGDQDVATRVSSRFIEHGLPHLNQRLTEIVSEWTTSLSLADREAIRSAPEMKIAHERESLSLKKSLLANATNVPMGQIRQFFIPQADGSIYSHLSDEMINHLATPDAHDAQTRLAGVFQDDMDIRDGHLVRQIAEVVKQGKNPFVVFGAAHVLKIRPALESLSSHET